MNRTCAGNDWGETDKKRLREEQDTTSRNERYGKTSSSKVICECLRTKDDHRTPIKTVIIREAANETTV